MAAVVLVGCGSASTTQSTANSTEPQSSASTVSSSPWSTPRVSGPIEMPTDPLLPAVAAVDLHTGDVIRLDWLLPSDKPVLLWFWAPH